MNAHELGFTDFLESYPQYRLRQLFKLGPKGRQDVRAFLDQGIRLDPRASHRLTGKLAGMVEQLLRTLDAPKTCFVISSDEELDGREMRLADALAAVSDSHFNTCISCIAGKVCYFKDGRSQSGYMLQPAIQRNIED